MLILFHFLQVGGALGPALLSALGLTLPVASPRLVVFSVMSTALSSFWGRGLYVNILFLINYWPLPFLILLCVVLLLL